MQNTPGPIKDFDDEANLGLFYILSANFGSTGLPTTGSNRNE